MVFVNIQLLQGRLGNDPQLKYFESGTAKATFRLYTEMPALKGSGKPPKGQWHSIVAWGRIAEACAEYVHKGDWVWIEGYADSSSWETKEGKKREKKETAINKIKFFPSRGRGDAQAAEDAPQTTENEVPF